MARYERVQGARTEVWVVERRGATTWERRAKSRDGKGAARLRAHFATEDAAESSLARFQEKRVAEGWTLIDPDAAVDDWARTARPQRRPPAAELSIDDLLEHLEGSFRERALRTPRELLSVFLKELPAFAGRERALIFRVEIEDPETAKLTLGAMTRGEESEWIEVGVVATVDSEDEFWEESLDFHASGDGDEWLDDLKRAYDRGVRREEVFATLAGQRVSTVDVYREDY